MVTTNISLTLQSLLQASTVWNNVHYILIIMYYVCLHQLRKQDYGYECCHYDQVFEFDINVADLYVYQKCTSFDYVTGCMYFYVHW